MELDLIILLNQVKTRPEFLQKAQQCLPLVVVWRNFTSHNLFVSQEFHISSVWFVFIWFTSSLQQNMTFVIK